MWRGPSWPQGILSARARRALALVAQPAYPLAFAALYPVFGADTFSFAVVPVGLAAWACGARAGVASALLQFAARSAIVATLGASEPGRSSDLPTVTLLFITAIAVGFLRAMRIDLIRRAREAEALAGATGELAAGAAANETLQGILTAAMSAVPSTIAIVILPDDAERLRIAAVLGAPQAWVGLTYPSSTGISGRAWRSSGILRVDDVTRHPEYLKLSDTTRSALAVPIERGGERRGLIYFEDGRPQRFGARDVRIMRAFADHAWVALERADQQHELAIASDRFAAVFSAVPSSLFITRADDQRIVDANDAFLRLIGRTRAEVIGRSGLELGLVDAATHARVDAIFRRDCRLVNEAVDTDRLGDGTRHFLVSSEVVPLDQEAHVVTVATEVTERRRSALELERLALVDTLTGLPNRNAFLRRLETLASAGDRPIAVLLLDIDHFKDVNDTFGHRAGDELLRKVGRRLQADLSAGDIVARLGGDEFALLIESDAAAAVRIAETARRSLEIPFELEGHAIVLTGSVGISFFPEHGASDTALLRLADIAMYAAKRSGAGTMVYARVLDAHSPARLALAADLRRAIADGSVGVHFQPIVPLQPGRGFGLESLLRWTHPMRGPIAPGEFVPIAERSGLIKPMTELVLDRALKRASSWVVNGCRVSIAVNVSMRNLRDPAFVETVIRSLAARDVEPGRLQLEITETVAMSDPDVVISVLGRLWEAGVRIAIDDFGTGYSSLAYLRRLPVHAVKIDRSFIAGLERDAATASIVKATIEVGRSLGLSVVAEGVETDEQLMLLRNLGCDRAQGYAIARPMSGDDVQRWLDAEADRYRV